MSYAIDIRPNSVATYRKHRDIIGVAANDVVLGDVRSISLLPRCDIMLGCYPCQSFTMGGPRRPSADPKVSLFREFIRCIGLARPCFFIAENVAGLAWLEAGKHLREQLVAFREAGEGYRVSWAVLNARDFGVPADRKRVFIVGCRRDLGMTYTFPEPTNGPSSATHRPWASHGEAIAHLPVEAHGEYYNYRKEPFSWWYMSRNRKRPWGQPGYAVPGNWRHIPLHPSSPTMKLVESELENRSRQRWAFSGQYDDNGILPSPPRLEVPRRLSWRECAAIQTFPKGFEPAGSIESKLWQIGNAVPPMLMELLVRRIVDGIGFEEV